MASFPVGSGRCVSYADMAGRKQDPDAEQNTQVVLPPSTKKESLIVALVKKFDRSQLMDSNQWEAFFSGREFQNWKEFVKAYAKFFEKTNTDNYQFCCSSWILCKIHLEEEEDVPEERIVCFQRTTAEWRLIVDRSNEKINVKRVSFENVIDWLKENYP